MSRGPAPLELAGQLFGRLTAIRRTGAKRRGTYVWLCECVCGKSKEAIPYELRAGAVQSCGCLLSDMLGERNAALATHRHTAGGRPTPEYRTWISMQTRCLNPHFKDYDRYGGAGITICQRWGKFENFLADMGPRPAGMTIERLNSAGNYEPENCVWATSADQNRNVSRNRWIEFGGERLILEDWAHRLGMSASGISGRIAAGWPLSRALTQPRRNMRRRT